LPKRLPPSSCAREPLRACSCAPAAGGTRPPRGVARAPLGASAACAALGVGLLRACPWGALRRAPGEGPSARRLLGRAPPRAAAWGAAPPRAAWRPRERTRGSRDRIGEMGSGVCVGVAGVIQSKKFLLLTSNLKTLTDWANGSNGRAMEENENKKEITKGRFSFPGP